jgi:hypothetical protein
MQSTIIELSRYTSDDKPSNAEWTTRLAKPVTLEDGDYVMIKQAFIDTRQIDNNSILIEKDINWTLRFVYWIQCHSINQRSVDQSYHVNEITPDGLPYMLCDARATGDPNNPFLRGKPVVDSFVIHIPQGTYERAAFAEYITRQMQSIKQPQNYTFPSNYLTRGITIPLYDASNNFTGFTDYDLVDPNLLVTSFSKPVYYGQWIQQPPQPPRVQTMLYKDVNTDKTTYYSGAVYFPMTDAPNYNYPNSTLVTYSSSVISSVNAYNSTFYLSDGSVIGASQMSFVYNDNGGNGRFSFQYMHSPLITGGTNGGNEVVGTYMKSPDNGLLNVVVISYLNAYSGIMLVDTFTDGDTDSFLNQLGFKKSDLIPPDVADVFAFNNNCVDNPTTFKKFSYYDTFLKYTTRNVLTIGDVTTNATTTVGNTQMISYSSIYCSEYTEGKSSFTFDQSQLTEEIVATNPPISSTTNAGHFLIELQNVHNSSYINQEKFYNIKAIVGNYFLSGDSFTMSMAPDSYVYQHKGQPLTLSSIKVRLLNPVTKDVADNIGTNSTIYLQVTKEKETIQQEKQKDEKK